MADRSISTKRLPLLLLAALFLLRALIPAGYMPGNLLDGEFVRLCPVGLPEGALADLHAGHTGHGGHGETSAADADASCPAGILLSAAILIGPTLTQNRPAPLPVPVPAQPPAASRMLLWSTPLARAPPV